MNKLKIIIFVLVCYLTQSCDTARNNSKTQTVMVNGNKLMWVGGEDGGSWFSISKPDSLKGAFLIKRYFEDKTFYGEGVFTPDSDFDINKEYNFIPTCTSEKCRIKQGRIIIEFKLKQ